MKYLFALLLIAATLCSCNIEDDPQPVRVSFSTKVQDYALSGATGTVYTFVTTSTLTDTANTTTTTIDTTLWTIVDRNAIHPVGGSGIQYTEVGIKNGVQVSSYPYYMTSNDTMLAVYFGNSSARRILLKAPIATETIWTWLNSTSPEVRITKTNEEVTLPPAIYSTTRTESQYSFDDGPGKRVTHVLVLNLAKGVGICKQQEDILTSYGTKTSTEHIITELRQVK